MLPQVLPYHFDVSALIVLLSLWVKLWQLYMREEPISRNGVKDSAEGGSVVVERPTGYGICTPGEELTYQLLRDLPLPFPSQEDAQLRGSSVIGLDAEVWLPFLDVVHRTHL